MEGDKPLHSSDVRFIARHGQNLDQFEREVISTARYQHSVTFRSRGRRYTFIWHRRAKRLLVKIGEREDRTVRPLVEKLAQKLDVKRVCLCPIGKGTVCGKEFERNRKQQFCSPAHAVRARKARWASKLRQRRAEERASKLAQAPND